MVESDQTCGRTTKGALVYCCRLGPANKKIFLSSSCDVAKRAAESTHSLDALEQLASIGCMGFLFSFLAILPALPRARVNSCQRNYALRKRDGIGF